MVSNIRCRGLVVIDRGARSCVCDLYCCKRIKNGPQRRWLPKFNCSIQIKMGDKNRAWYFQLSAMKFTPMAVGVTGDFVPIFLSDGNSRIESDFLAAIFCLFWFLRGSSNFVSHKVNFYEPQCSAYLHSALLKKMSVMSKEMIQY